jgi:hypothetical protein
MSSPNFSHSEKRGVKGTHCAKYQRATCRHRPRRQYLFEPLGFAGELTPGSCNGLFSVGFPTGVQGHLPHPTQRTSSITRLPTSLNRGRPNGHREALLLNRYNFQRVAHAPFDCKRRRHESHLPRCNFPRIATLRPESKLLICGKPTESVGNRLLALSIPSNAYAASRLFSAPQKIVDVAGCGDGPSRPVRGQIVANKGVLNEVETHRIFDAIRIPSQQQSAPRLQDAAHRL